MSNSMVNEFFFSSFFLAFRLFSFINSALNLFLFIDRIQPICLPLSEELIDRRFGGSNPFIAGWGDMEEGTDELTPVLQQVQVPIVSNKQCKRNYKKINEFEKDEQFDDRVVCAGFTEGGKDSCQGDSGGPLMLPLDENDGNFSFFQVGIVSWGNGCAKANIPGVYVNVQYYADWIKEKIAKKIK